VNSEKRQKINLERKPLLRIEKTPVRQSL